MNTGHPKVSVVIPTYDRADRIERSIESVLRQTYTDFELIVVDDGSKDDTTEVVAEFSDSRIRLIEHDRNRGASAARNTGIEQAKGDIVAFQDSDDEWLPEKLEKQMDLFEKVPENVGVVYTGMHRTVNGEERYLPYSGVEPKVGDIRSSIVEQNFISTQMAAVRRSCFEEYGGFDEEISGLGDWELWIRLSERYQFRYIDEPLVKGAVQSDSLSRNRWKKVRSREKILNRHRETFDRQSLAKHCFHIGSGAMRVGRTKLGRRYLLKAVRTDPKPQYVAALASSVFGSKSYSTLLGSYKRISARGDARI